MTDKPNQIDHHDRESESRYRKATGTHRDSSTTPLNTAIEGGQAPRTSVPLPKKIGQYTIKRVIASGGMGVVYEALQEKPRRTVALKVMKAGIVSTNALRRFEYESQLLARLQHSGIAQVFEAGTHDEGTGAVPYFAMEYIPNARSVTGYAEEKKLGTRERMQLFARVCDAVHHGHQKGIIHRDLKPGNILVSPQGQVKIIDFGVARSTDSDMAMTTLQTDVGQLIGTLQYMSPEQCKADPHDIDIRSDVYALGVVQYELLCGRLPYDVGKKAFHEMTRVIREEQPTRPSTISKQLRGDVETIALKALEKERDRRYQSAVELAQDIRRYIAGEAIVGRPPSIVYQLRIFARRHRALFGALSTIFVVLAAGLVVTTGMYLRAEQARENTARERDRALAAEQEAEAVTAFLGDTLAAVDPSEARGNEVTIWEVLDKASETIDGSFPEQPLVEGKLRSTIGNTYSALGIYPTAEQHLKGALEIRARILGREHPDTLIAMKNLGELHRRQGRYDIAESMIVEALHAQLGLLGEEHPHTLDSIACLASVYTSQDRYSDAEPLRLLVSEILTRVVGEEHPKTLNSRNELGEIYLIRRKFEEAERLYERTLEIQLRELGEEHPDTLDSMSCLASAYEKLGKYDESEHLLRHAVELYNKVFGEEHPETLTAMTLLALHLVAQGHPDEAEPLLLQSLEIRRRVLGDTHRHTLNSLFHLRTFYREQGRADEFQPLEDLLKDALHGSMKSQGSARYAKTDEHGENEQLLLQTLEIRQLLLGADQPSTLRAKNNLGKLYTNLGRYEEAGPLLTEAQELQYHLLGEDHPDSVDSLYNLALLNEKQGRNVQAEKLYLQMLALYRARDDKDMDTLREVTPLEYSIGHLAYFYLSQERYEEAEPLFEEYIQLITRVFSSDFQYARTLYVGHGKCLMKLLRYEEAEAVLFKAYDGREAILHSERERTVETIETLIELYEAWEKPEQVTEWRNRLSGIELTFLEAEKEGP